MPVGNFDLTVAPESAIRRREIGPGGERPGLISQSFLTSIRERSWVLGVWTP